MRELFWGDDYVLCICLNTGLFYIGVCICQKFKECTPKICIFLYLNFASKEKCKQILNFIMICILYYLKRSVLIVQYTLKCLKRQNGGKDR